jgi:arginase
MLALRRLGHYGLVSIDGGLDFRHPGNAHLAGPVGSVAGEDLAVVTGRGAPALTDLEGRRPLVAEADVIAMGHRGLDGLDDEVLATPMTCSTRPSCAASAPPRPPAAPSPPWPAGVSTGSGSTSTPTCSTPS